MDKVRIDQWLWSVRIFKSRTLAAKKCKTNKIMVNDMHVKPSYKVVVGDLVDVKKNGFDLKFKIEKLIARRVSAALAIPCYTDLTPEEELNKFKSWFVGKANAEIREKGLGRPTKRDRRELEDYKFNSWDEYDDFDELDD